MPPKTTIKQLISFGLMLAAISYCGAKTDSLENEVRRLEMDIPSLYLINGMFLSADQARQLAGFLAESARINGQNRKDIRQFVLNHQREIDLLLDQMITGKKETAPPAFAKGRPDMQLGKVRNEWQDIINRGQHGLDELARKTLAILTPAQRDILGRFVPCFIPPGDFRNPERVGQSDGDTSQGEAMLTRLRRSPPENLNNVIERALDGLAPHIMKEQHAELTKPQIDELRDELRPSLKELTTRIRNMNDSDFELEKSKLANEFFRLYSAPESKSDGGESVKIKRYILNPGITAVIAQRAGNPRSLALYKEEVTPAAVMEEIKQKTEAFQAANLINNLQLTAGQARQLLPCIRKAVNARAEIDLEAAAIFPQALTAYAALKKELENQQISQPTEKEAQKFNHQLKMLYLEKLSRSILDCQSEMDRLLSVEQVAFLMGRQKEMQGDRAPIEQIKKNISVVRARAGEAFDKMDKMKDAEFTVHSRNLCAQFIESCVSIGAVDGNDVDKDAEIIRAEQILARARRMNRSEYNKNRDDLIAEICPRRNKPRPEMFGWHKSMGDQLETVNPSTQLLLSQTGMTMVEKKIKAGN